MGYDTVSLVIPASSIVHWDDAPLLREIDLTIGFIRNFDTCPRIIVHAFSHTGWLSLGLLLERGGSEQQIDGIIIDSAPSLSFGPQLLAKGLAAAYFRLPNPGLLSMVFLPIAHFFLSRHATKALVSKSDAVLNAFLQDGAGKLEELYVYSSGDAIISEEDIAAHVQTRTHQSCRVKSIVFYGCNHVHLYKDRVRDYQDALCDFMLRCEVK